MRIAAGRRVLLWLAYAFFGAGNAGAVDFAAVLPSDAAAQAAIDASPAMLAAREEVPLGNARSERLRAGQYEWEASVFAQARTDAAGRHYREQQFELQRRFRLPGKAGLDRQLGEFAVASGESLYGEARHQAARLLLSEWMEGLRAQAAEMRQAERVQRLRDQLGGVASRVAAGDAARVDEELASTELAMAEAALTASRRAAEAARLAITRDFPTLDVALPPSVPEPQEPAGDEASWAERIMAHDHGLELAETTAAASRLALQRARRERLPDPTLGLQYSDNFDTNREVVGLRLIVPLGVSGRSADIAAARSRAAMADANRDRARRAGEHDAHAAFLDAQAAIAQWRQAASAALTAERTAQALFEGYRLGEYDFAAVLTARRQAADATGQSDLARIAAWEANALLQIDAHLMWAAPEASEHGLAPLSPP